MELALTPHSYFIAGAMLSFLVIGFLIAAILPGVDRVIKRYVMSFYFVILLCLAVSFADAFASAILVDASLAATFVFLEFLLFPLWLPMHTACFLYCCGERVLKSTLFRTVMALECIYLVLLVAAQFTNFFYYISPDCRYYQGPGHPLLMAPQIAIMFCNFGALIRKRNKLPRKYFIAFLINVVPGMVVIAIHAFVYIVDIVYLNISVCTFVMFFIIMSDQVEQHARQQRKIAQQRASIMVLQMRPHFIYNTMTSIYYLCDQDSRKAQQVTMDFTTYLRKNFAAIASEDAIPFSEELEHTRAYLAVEQALFEESLFVDFDTSFVRFKVPPLTMQPIVENAIKHGLDPESDPLHISIRTRQTNAGSEIVVEDDGPGYDIVRDSGPADDSEPHIALANIEQRLEMMCGGAISISSRVGGGTVVKITIP